MPNSVDPGQQVLGEQEVFFVVFDEEDIFRSYDLGVNSFITKPVTFAGLVEAMKVLSRYWFEIVELPAGPHQGLREHN